jgi:hypothetical protein
MSSTQWANIGEDAGALHALLERITEHLPVPAIDYLWIFPARRIAIGESIVVVVAGFDDDTARRRVSTAHFTVARNRKGAATVTAHFAEHGSAPESAVPRIVEGVLRRLGEDTDAAPREEQIHGDTQRWDALIVDLGGRPRATEPDVPAASSDPDADTPAHASAAAPEPASSQPADPSPAPSSEP